MTKIHQQSPDNYSIIKNFVPLIGLLHVSLNSREHIIKIHWDFFNKLFLLKNKNDIHKLIINN